MIRYADDFIITGISQELLRDVVLPVVKAFLQERGLSLSEEKTRITRIEEGFDFLETDSTKWQFFETIKGKGGQSKIVDLFRAVGVTIVRHVKIRGAANPYDPSQKGYFRCRSARGWARLHPALAGCTI